MKKLFIAIGGLIFLLLAAIIVIPLVVDVDKYRPQIVSAANEHIYGKIELGKLTLSLWGQIRVEVEGLSLSDAAGRKVLSVRDAFFHVSFSSIFAGAPLLTFKMTHPEVIVIKDKTGKLNVMTLIRPSSTPPSALGAPNAPAEPVQPTELPAIATRARLGFEWIDALVTYKDVTTQLSTQVRDLNFVVKDLSLSRETEMELWANLDTKMGKTLSVQGPARMKATALPQVTGGKFEGLALKANIDLDGLDIRQGDLFHKSKGMAANADLSLNASEREATIDHFDVKFFNAVVKISGTITNLTPDPIMNIVVKSNEIDFKPWSELVPMLKEYELGGTGQLDAMAKGPSSKLDYKFKFSVNNLTAKAGDLKAQPRFDAVLSVITDQIDELSLTMKSPGNDLRITGKVASFVTPKADFQVTSSGMDLDQLINFPPSGAAPQAGASAAPVPGGAAPKTDFDALLEPLRENKMLANTQANVSVNMKSIKAKGAMVSDILARMTFRSLTAAIEQFSMKVFSSTITAKMAAQLRPVVPTYQFSTTVTGFDIGQAVASQMQMFKNTVVGKADFSMNGEGASFNSDQAIGALKAKGKMAIANARFASIDVGKMVAEGLNKAIDKIAEKIPAAKGKKISGLPGGESKYELFSSDFVIADGKFSAPNFTGKAAPNQGIDLRGDTLVGMKDQTVKARWEIIDTYNLTHAKDISVEQLGTKVDAILAEKGKPVTFPVSVGCTLAAPCYSYTEVPEFLAKVALNNISGAAQDRVKSEAKSKAKELIQKNIPKNIQVPPELQNQLNNLFH